ncbi:MAG: septal ring lytic transglycosylase RlpA family protein [Pseudomonadota bacterium]|nr:septal ring lytic transglycosylase RlpA family protein [Pseudomonadota bacterium]
MSTLRLPVLAGFAVLLAACSSSPEKASAPAAGKPVSDSATQTANAQRGRRQSPYAPAQEDPAKRGNYVAGGLYAPGVKDSVPDYIPDVEAIPEPEVVHLPRSVVGNRSPYTVLGKRYTVMDEHRGYVEQGRASYYGNKFHGRRTSNQEVYDMYAFTAAHRSLPLPSFARVTNLENGKSVIVRVNDRGPFHENRLIDLSYAAAVKLGFREAGTARVEVRALLPEDMNPSMAAAQTPAAAAAVVVAPAASARQGSRFDMQQNGRPMTADEFDAWMRARQIRIATGVPGKPDPVMNPAAQVAPAASAIAAPPTAPVLATAAQPVAANGIELQVASFASMDNAERALHRLRGAGVPEARLMDAAVNGRRIWRLRVGPLQESAVAARVAQIASLGFGQPTRIRQ